MTSVLKTYKPSIIFIVRFLLVYSLLVLLYGVYQSHYIDRTDPLTIWVGKTVTAFYRLFPIDAQTIPLTGESGLKLILEGRYVARIVEGCTAASIIILFISFILSIGKPFKKALLFAILGSLFIFLFNILRIVLLGYILYVAPQHQTFAHQILFPVLIYGFVVFLWLVFILKYYDPK